MQALPGALNKVGPEAVAKVKGVFRFDITEKKKVVKTWTADLKNGDGLVPYWGHTSRSCGGLVAFGHQVGALWLN